MAALTFAVPRPAFSRGFSLLEMAVVLVILALLIGGMMLPLSAQQEIRARQETEKTLNDIREALIGYAASHAASDGRPYLPCPDTDNDGIENRSARPGPCVAEEGALPSVDLGLGRNDLWNNRFRYRVTAGFSDSSAGFVFERDGDMDVCASNACASGAKIAEKIPVVMLSHGPNGFGALRMNGNVNDAPADADEQENANGDTRFVSKPPNGAFDDLVLWVPRTVLMNRMMTAGRLP